MRDIMPNVHYVAVIIFVMRNSCVTQPCMAIQRRLDGSVDFYRPWKDYKTGFGNANGEYWLGNDNIHELTSEGKHTLKILMTNFSDVSKFAAYSNFYVDSEAALYQMSFSNYSGNAGDSFNTVHNHQRFSTFDQDHDSYSGYNCATHYKGAWWYSNCYDSNLNGLYNERSPRGVIWETWLGAYHPLKTTMMLIRNKE